MLEKIGQLLIKEKFIDNNVLEAALIESENQGIRLGEYLVNDKKLSEEALFFTLADQFSIPFLRNIEDNIGEIVKLLFV